RRSVLHKNNFGLQLNQFSRSTLSRFRIIERPPTKFDVDIAAFRPPEFLESFPERGQISVKFWVALGMRHEYADASRSTGLLRLRRNWPCRRRAANDLDEIAPSHRLPRRLRTRYFSGLNYHTGSGWVWGRQCPLWATSKHVRCKKRCPLYPQKRHQTRHSEMSALGQ